MKYKFTIDLPVVDFSVNADTLPEAISKLGPLIAEKMEFLVASVDCDKCKGDGMISCTACGGSGDSPDCDECSGGEVECPDCGGEGCDECDDSGFLPCDECDGNGTNNCRECDGEGVLDCDKCYGNLTVEIDMGMTFSVTTTLSLEGGANDQAA